jgi:hypothetical protein
MCPSSLSWPLKSSHDTEQNTKAPALDGGGPHFAVFAQRAFCASASFALVAALIFRFAAWPQNKTGKSHPRPSPTPVWLFCLVYVSGAKPPEQAAVPGTQE